MFRDETLKKLSIDDIIEIQELREISVNAGMMYRLDFYSFIKKFFGLNRDDMKNIYTGSIFQ